MNQQIFLRSSFVKLTWLLITVPERGIRKIGSDQQITQRSRLSDFKVEFFSDPPFGIPLWGTVSSPRLLQPPLSACRESAGLRPLGHEGA